MKDNWNIKKFLALFMAVAMVMASGIFVTTQSFKAGEDDEYETGNDEEYAYEDIGDDIDEEDVSEADSDAALDGDASEAA